MICQERPPQTSLNVMACTDKTISASRPPAIRLTGNAAKIKRTAPNQQEKQRNQALLDAALKLQTLISRNCAELPMCNETQVKCNSEHESTADNACLCENSYDFAPSSAFRVLGFLSMICAHRQYQVGYSGSTRCIHCIRVLQYCSQLALREICSFSFPRLHTQPHHIQHVKSSLCACFTQP